MDLHGGWLALILMFFFVRLSDDVKLARRQELLGVIVAALF